jgi:hypothetical protein
MKIAFKELTEIYQEEKELLQDYLRILADEQRSISSQNEKALSFACPGISSWEMSDKAGAAQMLAHELDRARMLEGLKEAGGQAGRDIYLLRIRWIDDQSISGLIYISSIPSARAD